MSKERPWEAGPFEPWVSDELNYRVNNLSKGISDYSTNGNKVEYYGPRKAWARVFSNGMNLTTGSNLTPDGETEWGLVFKSGNGFFERYGVSNNQNDQGKQVYGYSNKEKVRYVDSQTRINVPDPGITSIETEIQKNFFSKVTINWVCHSIDQLKAIAPYFTTPLTTVIVEFGWNTFDPISIIPINNYNIISKIWENYYTDYSKRLTPSRGNYDYIFGQIVNFEYSIEDNIIKGKTEVYSRQTFYNGFVTNGTEGINDVKDKDNGPRESYAKYFNEVITQIISTGKSPTSDITNLQIKNLLSTVEDPFTGELKYGLNLENLNDYVFTSRDLSSISVQAKDRDFDTGNTDKIKNTWITMELLVDILNQIKNNNDEKLLQFYYEMDINGIKIGAHPNLISTNKMVLIPNPHAPKLNSPLSNRVQEALQQKYSEPSLLNKSDAGIYNVAARVIAETDAKNARDIAAIKLAKEQKVDENLNHYTGSRTERERQVAILKANLPPLNKETLNEIYNKKYEESIADKTITSEALHAEEKNRLVNIDPINSQSFFEHSPISPTNLKTPVGADYILSSYASFSPKLQREDLDWVLNRNNRTNQSRNITLFNVSDVDGLEKGWLKNLYINLDFIKTTISNVNLTTLREIYDEILKTVNGSTCAFWDLQVSDIPDTTPGNAKLKIIDHKGPFDLSSSQKVFNFEYMTNKSIIKKLNFTTTLSNAQANQVLFRASSKEYASSNNLIDFTSKNQFQDRILKDLPKKPVVGSSAKDNSQKKSYFTKIAADGDKTQDGFLQITTFEGTTTPANAGRKARLMPTGGGEITGYVGPQNESPYNIVDLVIPYPEILTFLLNDNDLDNNINIYNSPLRNIHVELSLMGIAGIKTFEVFKISNLPPPYTEDTVVFQVENVMHTINEDTWETRIKANLRPARLLLKQSQNK